jgi:RNA polymerase sigma-70 factor (ECF subfamily)
MAGEPAVIPNDAWAGFQSRLRSYVGRRVGAASVEDVVGDIMLRLVQHRETLATTRNPTAWVLRVAANAVSDHHRRRNVERRALSQYQAEDAGMLDQGRDTDETDLACCLVPFIQGLPEPYRQALLLADIAGQPHAETARRLDLTVSGVKARVRRGRAKLREALLRCCAIHVDGRGRVMEAQPRDQPCTGCT